MGNIDFCAPMKLLNKSYLDQLMDQAEIGALIVTSKHNIQYFLGGYRFFFFGYQDAIGTSRYLPAIVYIRHSPENTLYIGNSLEKDEKELEKFWVNNFDFSSWSSEQTARSIADHLTKHGITDTRVGLEKSFVPIDSAEILQKSCPNNLFVDALPLLEELRAVKSSQELAILRSASDLVVQSMLAVFEKHGPGSTKAQLTESLRQEEVKRGMTFEYCLITTGKSHNRSPSNQKWEDGQILSLDSGGNYKGYIGDLCRMAVHGRPSQELESALDQIDSVQKAARKPIKSGITGAEIYESAMSELQISPLAPHMSFVAHGMGIIPHEAPRLSTVAPVPYSANYAQRPLRAGMVLSIETTMPHPKLGFIKLEDTIAVTKDGHEAFGDIGRGWNLGQAKNSY